MSATECADGYLSDVTERPTSHYTPSGYYYAIRSNGTDDTTVASACRSEHGYGGYGLIVYRSFDRRVINNISHSWSVSWPQ